MYRSPIVILVIYSSVSDLFYRFFRFILVFLVVLVVLVIYSCGFIYLFLWFYFQCQDEGVVGGGSLVLRGSPATEIVVALGVWIGLIG